MTRNGGCVARPSVSEGLVEGSDVEPKIGVGGDRDDTFRFHTADESGALDRVVGLIGHEDSALGIVVAKPSMARCHDGGEIGQAAAGGEDAAGLFWISKQP